MPFNRNVTIAVCVVAWCCCVTAYKVETTNPVIGQGAEHHKVTEAQEGDTATLPCPSNDDGHRFLFWQLDDDKVIGPANPGDRSKYKYEVLSGDLYIKHVTAGDAGQYKCVSKGLMTPSFNIKPVDLIVKKDWEMLWESDTSVNLLRGVLAMSVIAVLCGIAIVMFKMRRSGYIKDDELSEDDMPEEIGDGPYHTTTQRISPDNLSLVDTELPRALNSMYSERL